MERLRAREWLPCAVRTAQEMMRHGGSGPSPARVALLVPYLATLIAESPHAYRFRTGAFVLLRRQGVRAEVRRQLGARSWVLPAVACVPPIGLLLLGLVLLPVADGAPSAAVTAAAPWSILLVPLLWLVSALLTPRLAPGAGDGPLPTADWLVVAAFAPTEDETARAVADAVAVAVDPGESVATRLVGESVLGSWDAVGFTRIEGDAVDVRLVRSAVVPPRT